MCAGMTELFRVGERGLLARSCRQPAGNNRCTPQRANCPKVSAGCRDLQAGSLRSPERLYLGVEVADFATSRAIGSSTRQTFSTRILCPAAFG